MLAREDEAFTSNRPTLWQEDLGHMGHQWVFPFGGKLCIGVD
jgi:hypothetical protein